MTLRAKPRIKVCGLTRVEDVQAAVAAGVDAIGLVFFSGSKRAVDVAQAQAVVRTLPPLVSAVGLFVNADAAEVAAVLQQVPLDVLQFHGDETAAFCRQFARPYIKAVRVAAAADIDAAARDFTDARALLLDAAVPGQYGGTGQRFDWQLLPAQMPMPWLLAGGLDADNVAQAIAQSRAVAVDVSGGVESAPGIKDVAKMAAFIRQARGG